MQLPAWTLTFGNSPTCRVFRRKFTKQSKFTEDQGPEFSGSAEPNLLSDEETEVQKQSTVTTKVCIQKFMLSPQFVTLKNISIHTVFFTVDGTQVVSEEYTVEGRAQKVEGISDRKEGLNSNTRHTQESSSTSTNSQAQFCETGLLREGELPGQTGRTWVVK